MKRSLLIVAMLYAFFGAYVPSAKAQQFVAWAKGQNCLHSPIFVPPVGYDAIDCSETGWAGSFSGPAYLAYSSVTSAFCSTGVLLKAYGDGSASQVYSESDGASAGGAYVDDYFIRYPDGSGVGSPPEWVPC